MEHLERNPSALPGVANQNPGEGLVLKPGSMKTNPNDPISVVKSESGMYQHDNDYESWLHSVRPLIGLTKREYFAATALQGYLSTDYTINPEAAARESVKYADALIAELNKV